MKKFISILLVLSLLLGVSGCGKKNNPQDAAKEPTNETETSVAQSFEELEKMPSFSCQDIVTGNEVTDKVIGDYKLTIINIWSTT